MEPTVTDTDIAIIGLSCRLPGADDPEQFWRNLCQGRETVTFFTDAELLAAGADPELIRQERYVKAGQVIEGADRFAAPLFRIPREEAEILDPQQRVLLECALTALEDAGCDPARHPGPVGVYAGVGLNAYAWLALADRFAGGSALDRHRLMVANDKDFLATRVSYKLDLRGPSVNVNTACSTSLVAVHLACLSLLGGECDIALAGSAHLRVPQTEGYLHQDGMIFSPDGHCRAFDADARGTVIGSGAGVVVLKRLADALAEGDRIRAVVKGTAINNDGSRKAGYTAPSVAGQAAVITTAQQVADCAPRTIGYVEAHGTGTALGDPIEVAALNEAFADAGMAPGSCPIGSVKTNIGHLDTAAGMAGLIKTVLMLEHGQFVPTVNFKNPNPDIDFAGGPFYVNTEAADWPAGPWPRRAGVSSFGIGGTNAHVVLEEAPSREPAPAVEGPHLLLVSADTPAALERSAAALARRLRGSGANLHDVATTLALGRREHRCRRALVTGPDETADDAALALALADPGRVHSGVRGPDGTRHAFVCTGSLPDGGAHAAALYRESPAFRALVDALLPGDGAAGESVLTSGDAVAAAVAETALARLWTAWGVRPAAVIGLGAGRRAAACVAGATDPAALLDAGAVAERAPRIPLWRAGSWQAAGAVRGPAPATDDTGPTGAAKDETLDRVLAGTGWSALELYPGTGTGTEALLREVGRAWTEGTPVDWDRFYEGRTGRRVELPTYPFERARYWIDTDGPARKSATTLRERFGTLTASAQQDLLVRYLREEIGAALAAKDLGDELPDADRDLFELDVESLMLIEVVAKLGDELGCEVPLTAFIDHPTIRGAALSLTELPGYPGAAVV
ncbi:type I polyketide synthase [Streptomyces sp. NPDC059894]|uniref:type I polyketide synthase n=1 Tax=unclassified Streptomyces TaxID=2593676 RepID=UPI0036683CBB